MRLSIHQRETLTVCNYVKVKVEVDYSPERERLTVCNYAKVKAAVEYSLDALIQRGAMRN